MRNPFAVVFGSVLIILGGIFLLNNLGILDADWIFDNFWPLVFIGLGIAFLVRKPSWQRKSLSGSGWTSGSPMGQGTGEVDFFSESEVFGDLNREITSKRFSGGNCSVVFGAVNLEMTRMELLPGEQILRLSTVFGGVVLRLPAGLEYSIRCNHVAGAVVLQGERRGGLFQSVSYQTGGYSVAERRLVVQISSVFGDINIQELTTPLS